MKKYSLKEIKEIIVYLFDLLSVGYLNKNNKNNRKRLLIVRLDAIGDYVLFRNFLELLKRNPLFEDYSCTLVGNSVWKDISMELDSEFIDQYIWLDRKLFYKNFFYRFKKLKEVASSHYDIVINSEYSREFFFSDIIAKVACADQKISSTGDFSNIKKWQKKISDQYYNTLFPAEKKIRFEFERNREFFQQFLGNYIGIQKPNIKLEPKKFKLPKKYAILFIGANSDFRKWKISSFAKIGKLIKDKYKYKIVLCGGPGDVFDAKRFKEFFKDEYIDLVGKTSLPDLLDVINGGDLMITNETSAAHLAVALEVPDIFVVSNGNHYGRFTPYPKKMAPNYHAVYHPEIEKDLDDYEKLTYYYGSGSNLNINDITIEYVMDKIDNILDSSNINDWHNMPR